MAKRSGFQPKYANTPSWESAPSSHYQAVKSQEKPGQASLSSQGKHSSPTDINNVLLTDPV